MNHGPLIFLGVFATFVASWWGLIFAPHLQLGSQQPKQAEGSSALYPNPRPGVARQGAAVYVANGCVACHSQQVHQKGYTFDVVLLGTTNQQATTVVLGKLSPTNDVAKILSAASEQSPQPVLKNIALQEATSAQKALNESGANAQLLFIPTGADMDRGWGARHSVAQDYLYDYPVQIGNSRLGPDLANVGVRQPNANALLRHLYNPRIEVKGSFMPRYEYLFEKRKLEKQPSPDALKLSPEFAAPAGYEVVPTVEAQQLVAYLQSLRVDTALAEAPMTQLPPPPAPEGTNAPAGGTNAPGATATNAPTK